MVHKCNAHKKVLGKKRHILAIQGAAGCVLRCYPVRINSSCRIRGNAQRHRAGITNGGVSLASQLVARRLDPPTAATVWSRMPSCVRPDLVEPAALKRVLLPKLLNEL